MTSVSFKVVSLLARGDARLSSTRRANSLRLFHRVVEVKPTSTPHAAATAYATLPGRQYTVW